MKGNQSSLPGRGRHWKRGIEDDSPLLMVLMTRWTRYTPGRALSWAIILVTAILASPYGHLPSCRPDSLSLELCTSMLDDYPSSPFRLNLPTLSNWANMSRTAATLKSVWKSQCEPIIELDLAPRINALQMHVLSPFRGSYTYWEAVLSSS
jgi:hypothetical protein